MNDKPGLYIYVSKCYHGKRAAMELQAEKQASKNSKQTILKCEEIDLCLNEGDMYMWCAIASARRTNTVIYGTSTYSNLTEKILLQCEEIRECQVMSRYILVVRKKPVFEGNNLVGSKIIGIELLKRDAE